MSKWPPAVCGGPALPVVAQPPGGAAALGHPGEPGGGVSEVGALQGADSLESRLLITLECSSARLPGPIAPSFCPLTPTGTGCWPRRGYATLSSWCTKTTLTFCARICCVRPSPWLHYVSCHSAILSTRSVPKLNRAKVGGAWAAFPPDLWLMLPLSTRSSCFPTRATPCR